ncbi:hypothetical protein BASA81_003556 [Batrachochytrium salamandrivorans]|nr:hypothetical protein BASA81_003556 [Batrachochytrium salamandrivorans]
MLNRMEDEDGEWAAKVKLYANSAYMLMVASSLLYPSLLRSVLFGLVGSELSPVVLTWQYFTMKGLIRDHSKLVFGSWSGRLCMLLQTFSISVVARNLLQGVFAVPRDFANALESVGVKPTLTGDWSPKNLMWRILALVPAFAVSRMGQNIQVKRNIPYAGLDKKMLENWKRTPSLVRNINMLAFRGRHSNWLSLDLHHVADGNENKPVLLYFHGGGWGMGDKSVAGLSLMTRVAARGVVVVAANYRLIPDVSIADQVRDCKRALIFVKRNCHLWGGNSAKVFVSGESAGGHLSAMLGCTAHLPSLQPSEEGDTSVAGCLPIYGVFDMTDSDGHLAEIKEKYLGVPVGVRPLVSFLGMEAPYGDDSKHLYELISPTVQVRQLLAKDTAPTSFPPYFISHGTLDSLASYTDANKFYQETIKLWEKFPGQVPKPAMATVTGGVHGFGYFPSPRGNSLGDAFCDFIFHHSATLAKL